MPVAARIAAIDPQIAFLVVFHADVGVSKCVQLEGGLGEDRDLLLDQLGPLKNLLVYINLLDIPLKGCF